MRSLANLVAITGLVTALAAQSNPCIRVAHGQNASDRLGWSLVVIGDVNGDRINDYASGAPGCGSLGTMVCKGTGGVVVFDGRTGGVLFRVAGLQVGSMFGYALAGFADTDGDGIADGNGDIDGDSRADFIVAAPRERVNNVAQAGAVYVLSSRGLPAKLTGQTVTLAGLSGAGAGGRLTGLVKRGRFFGWAVASLGRVGAGVNAAHHIAIGEPGANGPRVGGGVIRNAGRVLVMSRGASTWKSSWAVFGAVTGQRMGEALAGVGDVSGDKTPDLLVGSPSRSRAAVYSGLLSKGAPVLHWAAAGPRVTGFGHRVCGLGDVNKDGLNEWVVTDPASARASIYSVKSVTPVHVVAGKKVGDEFGSCVAAAGDFDGDKTPDLLVGAKAADPWGVASNAAAGEVVCFSGATGLQLVQMIGQPKQQFGSAAACAGDLNGDKALDYVVGSFNANVGTLGSQLKRGQVKGFLGHRGPVYYGVGCPGPATGMPVTYEGGDGACIGIQNVRINLSRATPRGTGFLAVGMTRASVSLFGCRLLVGQIVSISTTPISTSGHAHVKMPPVPNLRVLRGFTGYSQWFIFGAGRWSASRGMATTLR